MYQSKRDAKAEQIAAVFHRKNHSNWLVTMELDDWIRLYNEYYSSMKLVEEYIENKEVKSWNK